MAAARKSAKAKDSKAKKPKEPEAPAEDMEHDPGDDPGDDSGDDSEREDPGHTDAAARLAEETGIDLSEVTGTGKRPEGIITERDVARVVKRRTIHAARQNDEDRKAELEGAEDTEDGTAHLWRCKHGCGQTYSIHDPLWQVKATNRVRNCTTCRIRRRAERSG